MTLLVLLVQWVAPQAVRRPPVILVDFTGQTYTTRQTLTATTTFRDCTFRGCRTMGTSDPDSYGGAIDLNSISVSLDFSGCLFEDCWAYEYGGAVSAYWCRSFSMNETSGSNCSADMGYSFCTTHIYSETDGSIGVRDAAAASCRCGSWITFDCYCGSYSSGNTTSVESVNSSANYAEEGGSAFHAYKHFKLSLHFCTFSRNAPANCLFFSNYIMNSDISCVALLNNSCQSYSEYPGLIFLLSTLAMSNCVFQLNTFDYFLGGDYIITFVNCVFDVPSLNKTESVSFSATIYIYEPQPTSLADCRTRTRSPTATRTPTEATSRTPTDTESQTPLFTAAWDVLTRRRRAFRGFGPFTLTMMYW
jgi:hypothetical protein